LQINTTGNPILNLGECGSQINAQDPSAGHTNGQMHFSYRKTREKRIKQYPATPPALRTGIHPCAAIKKYDRR
jgi:hypothetical protein